MTHLTAAERKFKTEMLTKLRGYLADGKERPASLTERYRVTVAKLAQELEPAPCPGCGNLYDHRYPCVG